MADETETTPEAAPEPTPAPKRRPRAKPKGYDVAKWKGLDLFVCRKCKATRFDEGQMAKHVGSHSRA